MEPGIAGHRGGILGLRRFLADHEEAIAYDLLSIGRRIESIGNTLSWWEFRIWLKYQTDTTSALVREMRHQAALEAIPDDERIVGTAADAIPIDELDRWLGWA
ncbi:hypothetical protein [Nocardia sp. NPDC052566]|uniref:hypothetical protein n=1 Tax=Nocardia sp. NPDC052566 TaxID=3364330 RepID=UPI0037CCC291